VVSTLERDALMGAATEIGFVFQSPRCHSMSVFDNVAWAEAARPTDNDIAERVREAAGGRGLTGAERSTGRAVGRMRKRWASRAPSLRPRYLLYDEPTRLDVPRP